MRSRQNRPLPIIDMHLHANRADDNGPPPTYLCPGFENIAHDPRLSWEAAFSAVLKNPAVRDAIRWRRDRRSVDEDRHSRFSNAATSSQ